MDANPWHNKITNAAQLGGIETSVLDNGPGRGVRIAWINTGTGLRYKVVINRAMDIADALYNQHSLAWLNTPGVTPSQPFSNKGIDWVRTFGGGLLTTCGLSHIGGPDADEYGERGLHGMVSNIPAEVQSIKQPDIANGDLGMSITGIVRQSQLFGPRLEMKRTIAGTLGNAVIKIHDEVVNRGNTPAPHMLMYHCNIGWPLADEGADIIWKGEWQPRDEASKRIFNHNNNFRKCPAPMDAHNDGGEEVAYVDMAEDAEGMCACGMHNANIGIALVIRFQKKQLPWFANWQHWAKGEYVTGLEPATNPPIGQARAREQNQLIFLQPGESRHYNIEFEILTGTEEIHNFISSNESE